MLVGNDGLPRVVDFGVARLRWQSAHELAAQDPVIGPSGERSFTFHGIISGTPGYMSPEQLAGEAIDAASDQFSFCAALYEALCGYLPFAGRTVAEQAQSVRGTMCPPPPGTPVPEEVFRILARGMAPDPSARFPTMGALLAALAVEHGQTASGAALSRRRTLLVLTLLCLPLIPMLGFVSDRYSRILRPAIGVSLSFIFATLAIGYTQRHALLANAFHRRMWTLLLITFVQNFFVRLVASANQMMPFRAIFALEMITWAGTTTAMATLPLRSIRWVPLLPLASLVIALCRENLPRAPLLLVYPAVLLAVLWSWHRAADPGATRSASGAALRSDRDASPAPPAGSRREPPAVSGGSAGAA